MHCDGSENYTYLVTYLSLGETFFRIFTESSPVLAILVLASLLPIGK